MVDDVHSPVVASRGLKVNPTSFDTELVLDALQTELLPGSKALDGFPVVNVLGCHYLSPDVKINECSGGTRVGPDVIHFHRIHTCVKSIAKYLYTHRYAYIYILCTYKIYVIRHWKTRTGRYITGL